MASSAEAVAEMYIGVARVLPYRASVTPTSRGPVA